MLRLQEFDLSTLLSREVLNEEDREDEVEGMLRFEDNKLPSRALLVFSPDPELGLIRRKLEEVEDGLAPPDSSSLLLAEPPLSPDLLKDPEPPPGLQDMMLGGLCFVFPYIKLRGDGREAITVLCCVCCGGELEVFVIICFMIIIRSVARWKQLLAD